MQATPPQLLAPPSAGAGAARRQATDPRLPREARRGVRGHASAGLVRPLCRCVTSSEQLNLLCLCVLTVTWDNGSPSRLLVLSEDGTSNSCTSGSAQGCCGCAQKTPCATPEWLMPMLSCLNILKITPIMYVIKYFSVDKDIYKNITQVTCRGLFIIDPLKH